MTRTKCRRDDLTTIWNAIIASAIVLMVVALFLQPLLARPGSDPRSSCQSNLRQLNTALLLYINDWDAMLPSSFLYGRSRTWDSTDFINFARERGTLPPLAPALRKSWPMVLWRYLRSEDAIWCPSDRGVSPNPAAPVSYYWKAAVDAAWFGGPDGRGPGARKEGDFDFPADQIILYEHTGWHWGQHNRGLVDGVKINCVFLDGHAAAVEIRDSGYTAGETPAEPLPKSGIGEPAWFNYSFGANNPDFNKAQNWDPHIWVDKLPEVEHPPVPPPGHGDIAATCQSNLRALALAFQMYYGDYDAVLPSSLLYGGSVTWNPDDFIHFARDRGTLPPSPSATHQSWPMLLYPFMRNKDIIWCPADRAVSDDPAARVSYYWKAAIDAAWYGGPDGAGPMARREGDFDFPACQMILYEHTGWHWGQHNRGLVDGVKINCAFLDGHVAAVEIRDSGYTHHENPPEPLPRSGVGEPAWFNYSFGAASPQFDTGQYWDPHVWGDNLP